MIAEVVSPTEIKLTAESELEHRILEATTWRAERVAPKPMQLFAGSLKLVATPTPQAGKGGAS